MTQRQLFSLAIAALLGAVLGFGGILQSCQAPNKAPFARFTFSPKEPKVGETVTFDGSQSSDSDGKIISYFWDFADGETAQGVTTTHAFKKEGEYDVILQVADDRGANTALAKTVRVVPPNQAPVAIFSVEPLEPTANQEITFDASAAADPDGTIVSYSWDFGDQTTGQGKTVTHSYKAAGTYKVTLTVTDDHGLTTRDTSVRIEVKAPEPTVLTVGEITYRLYDRHEIGSTERGQSWLYRYVLERPQRLSREQIQTVLTDAFQRLRQRTRVGALNIWLFAEAKNNFMSPSDYDHFLGTLTWESGAEPQILFNGGPCKDGEGVFPGGRS